MVKLEKSFSNAFKNMVATARTCYSAKGIIRDEDITEGHERLAKSIYRAGHHTTLQHTYFQFTLSNVSRQFVWSFLHSHPYYNSEQVSQRYVPIKPGHFLIPPLKGEALTVYENTINLQMQAYKRLSELLYPEVKREYTRRYRPYFKREKKYELLQLELPIYKSARNMEREIAKKAREVARYVIPVSAFTYLYHTINALTLFRYYRLSGQLDVPLEQEIVVRKMVEEVLRFEPMYEKILEKPLEIEVTPEYQFLIVQQDSLKHGDRKRFIREFDRNLDGMISKLVGFKENNEALIAQGVREVLGLPSSRLSDKSAIKLVLDPSRNRLLGETLNLTTLSKLTRSLTHATYTFKKKLSHSADSQDQRHRTTPASRPCLHQHIVDEPDYIIPELIRRNGKIKEFYKETMDQVWEGINRLRRLGVRDEFILYLLPNAVSIRFTESGDLLNLRHKYAMRLCYNAQEEIWRASLDEIRQIRAINPTIGKYLLPPCSLRIMADIHPVCPEGERFCGVKVWKLRVKDYRRIL